MNSGSTRATATTDRDQIKQALYGAPAPTSSTSGQPTSPPVATKEQVNGVDRLTFDEMYASRGVYGWTFSARLLSLNGHQVSLESFMAPPLKPDVDFFVATKEPLTLCPFCSSDADWPADIVFVRMPREQTIRPTPRLIRTTGRLEVGRGVDEETGFISMVRVIADRVDLLN